jgi:hypothetical protein
LKNHTYIVSVVTSEGERELASFPAYEGAYDEAIGFIQGFAMGTFSDNGKKKVEVTHYFTDKKAKHTDYVVLVDGYDQWNYKIILSFVEALDTVEESC